MPPFTTIPLFIFAFSLTFSAFCSDVVEHVAPAVVGLKIRRSNHQGSFTGSRIQRRQGVTVELDNEVGVSNWRFTVRGLTHDSSRHTLRI